MGQRSIIIDVVVAAAAVAVVGAVIGAVIATVITGFGLLRGPQFQWWVLAQAPRPISNVACGHTYQLEHTELYYPEGSSRVARNFAFGGRDRHRQPQYIWAENVLGQSTEIREARRVNRSLEYSTVTFLCLDDPSLEGHRASNVEVMRYRLNLRRPLRPQIVIRHGGPARN